MSEKMKDTGRTAEYSDDSTLIPFDASIVFSEKMQKQARRFLETIVDYKELRMIYTCAMKEVQTKFDILNTEFKVRYRRNPITSITTRLKTTASITEKLARFNSSLSVENIEKYI